MLIDNTFPKISVSYNPKVKVSERIIVSSSRDAFNVLIDIWNNDTISLFEEFYVLYLDRKNGMIGYRNMNRGSNCGTVVDIRLIFSIGLSISANAFILSHNHPSGNMKPSQIDTELTRKIKEGAKLLDLKLLDHLIVCPDNLNRYYSFSDEGLI